MIDFNVPPYVGKEKEYISKAIDNKKICGDGEFTKKCSKCLANTKNGSIFAADKLRLCNWSKLHCSRPCIIFA